MGLPPTTTKGSTDTVASTTFNLVSRKFPISHSGPTATIDTIPGLPKNYIQNCNFEANTTTGWSLFNTTLTSLIPTGSISAGAASITTFATTSSGALEGTYSLGTSIASGTITAGQGFISDNLTLDAEDKAKVMQISFSYSATTGSSLMNFSGTSSNTWAVYIYDNANSAWIQPAGVYNIVQGSGVGKCTATFQTPSNATTVRLAIICINANSSGAVAMLWDSFYLGPQIVTQGAAMTDEVAYTPTITGQGSVSNVAFTYKRVGDNLLVQGSFTVGTTTAVVASISLPSGMVLDTTKLGLNNNTSASGPEVGDYTTSNISQYGPIVTATATSTTVVYLGNNPGGTAGTRLIPQTQPVSSSVVMAVRFKVPISGWSSNVNLSSDTDTRVVAARYTTANTTSIANATFTMIDFGTKVFDTNAAVSGAGGGNNTTPGSGWKYTVQISGKYQISSGMGVTSGGGWAAGESVILSLYKNSSEYERMNRVFSQATHTSAMAVTGSTTVDCVAGDVLQIGFYQDSGAALNMNGTGQYVDITRVSGPAVVAASESVNGRYYGVTATITSSYSAMTWSTKDYDSHSAYSGTTITIPVSGKYDFVGQAYVSATTIAAGNLVAIALYKNNSNSNLPIYIHVYQNTNTTAVAIPFSFTGINCNAGDTIVMQIKATSTSPVITADNGVNYLTWKRVGN